MHPVHLRLYKEYSSPVTNLKAELDKGNPIVVFVTLDFAYPTWSKWDMGYEEKKTIVDNMHVVVLSGYNSNGSYHVSDPAGRGKYWVSKSRFENAYNALQWAVVCDKQKQNRPVTPGMACVHAKWRLYSNIPSI